jgi:hypothetical protein
MEYPRVFGDQLARARRRHTSRLPGGGGGREVEFVQFMLR